MPVCMSEGGKRQPAPVVAATRASARFAAAGPPRAAVRARARGRQRGLLEAGVLPEEHREHHLVHLRRERAAQETLEKLGTPGR